MREGFNFYRSYFDVYNELSKSDKLEFIDALLNRQFCGTEPTELKGMANFAYIGQKHSIDRQVKGFEDKTNTTLTPCLGGSSTPTLQVQVKGEVKGEVQEEKGFVSFSKSLKSLGAEDQLIKDWLKVRKTKKATDTETAFNGFVSQLEKSGKNINEVLKLCNENSWSGFKSDWVKEKEYNPTNTEVTKLKSWG